MTINELYEIFLNYPSVQTDTRKIKEGDLFFALKGPNFNGNQFAQQALDHGAVFAIVDEELFPKNDRLIVVDHVLDTLQLLAKKHREQFNIPFLAITGSNGKTTTKELIHAVLSTSYKTYTTIGNLNNHIGIPLTILSIQKDAEIAVIEMGANHQKEIEGYCKYTMPTHGIITNCGKAHLEGFGGVEGVRKGKGELFDYLKKHVGTIFVNTDYSYLMEMSAGIDKVITYSSGVVDASVIGHVCENKDYLEVEMLKGTTIEKIKTQLVGAYNLPNILAAVSIGKTFNVDDERIKQSLESYVPSNSRSQLIKKGSNTIILDAYNANPSSMKLAIENFAKMPGINKVLMIGGMMELGDESKREHKQLLDYIQGYVWKDVVLVGEQFEEIAGNYHFFKTSSEARDWYISNNFRDILLLLKGSRGIQMEKVLE